MMHQACLKQSGFALRLAGIFKLNEQFSLQSSWGTIQQFPTYTTIYTHEHPLNFDTDMTNVRPEFGIQRVVGSRMADQAENISQGFSLQNHS